MKPSRMIFELKDKIITFGSYQVAVMFVQPQSELIETYLHVKLAVSIRSHPVAPYKFIYIYKFIFLLLVFCKRRGFIGRNSLFSI